MNKKIIGLLLLALCAVPVTVSADVQSCQVNKGTRVGEITLRGEFEENKIPEYISLRVLKEGYSFDSLPSDKASLEITEYIDQVFIEDGKTNFEMSFVLTGSSRTLKAQISGEGFTKPWDLDIPYINEYEFMDAVDAVNAAVGSYDSFAQACAENNRMKALGFDYIIEAEVNSADVLKIVYESVKDVTPPLDREDSKSVSNLWKAASLADAMNKNISVDLKEKADCLDYFSEECGKWAKFVINNPDNNAKTKLCNLITGKNYTKIDDLEKALEEALILSVIRYPDGNGNIGAVLKGFSRLTGVTVDNEYKIYDKMAGKDYGSITDVLSAYETYKKETQSSYPTPGGGGGGGGAGSGGSKVTNSVISVNPSQTGTPTQEPLNMRFVDLETVEWAYEAISTLADRNIINGKSDTIFAPLDTVSREEFVKMLVCAAGYEDSSYTPAVFIDVDPNAWYAKYVNIAADKGMVSGIGEESFGIGEKISRQDMAVIIYRILEGKGVNLAGDSLTFDDADKVSDYAKKAVAALSNNGIVNGVGNNQFNPTGTATRAEAAKIIFNVLDKIDT